VARLRRGGHRPSMGRSAAAHRKNKIGAPPGRNQLIGVSLPSYPVIVKHRSGLDTGRIVIPMAINF
jgi:hypothetical protein